jgi:hypothetical protein
MAVIDGVVAWPGVHKKAQRVSSQAVERSVAAAAKGTRVMKRHKVQQKHRYNERSK